MALGIAIASFMSFWSIGKGGCAGNWNVLGRGMCVWGCVWGFLLHSGALNCPHCYLFILFIKIIENKFSNEDSEIFLSTVCLKVQVYGRSDNFGIFFICV